MAQVAETESAMVGNRSKPVTSAATPTAATASAAARIFETRSPKMRMPIATVASGVRNVPSPSSTTRPVLTPRILMSQLALAKTEAAVTSAAVLRCGFEKTARVREIV